MPVRDNGTRATAAARISLFEAVSHTQSDWEFTWALMISTLSVILLTWTVSSLVFIGIGLGTIRLVGRFSFRPEHLAVLFWIGWCTSIIFLQIWHLFLPVNIVATLVVGVLGAAGLALGGGALVALISVRQRLSSAFGVGVLVLLALWLANRCLASPMNPDAGLYHLSSVRWNADYPIVPGLVNLHRVLAYNSSYFLYVALFEFGVWWGKSHYVANGILLFWTFAPLVFCIVSFLFKRHAPAPRALFAAVLLSPLLRQVLGYNLTSPSPDFGVLILQVITAYWVVVLACRCDEPEENATLLPAAIILIVFVGVTIKLSFVGFGAGLMLALFAIRAWRSSPMDQPLRRLARFTVVAAVLAVGGWMLRGVIFSGYPAYPVPFGGVPVAWAATPDEVQDQYNMLRAWGWVPNVHWNQVLDNWDWLKPWFDNLVSRRQAVVVPFALSAFAVVIMMLRFAFDRKRKAAAARLWPCLLPPGAGTLYWLVMAPDVRWSGACFWILAAVLLALALAGTSRILLLLCSGALILNAASVLLMHALTLQPLWLEGNGDEIFYPTQEVVVRPFRTESGLVLYVPHVGFRCWQAPLPCTPNPNPKLRLRRPGDLQSGFIVDRPENPGTPK